MYVLVTTAERFNSSYRIYPESFLKYLDIAEHKLNIVNIYFRRLLTTNYVGYRHRGD